MPTMIEARGLGKRFGATRALHEVSFTAEAGERLAILGENGAGKSTLIKIIAGVFAPDAGELTLAGEPYAPGSPAGALADGVSIVYQEPSFFPRLTVLENLFAGRELTDRWGQIDSRAMSRRAAELFSSLGIATTQLERIMGELSLAEQQLVLIARAVDVKSRVLILDEPTSILTDAEARTLFAVVDRLSAAGVTVLYITHRFDELERVADRFLVLKDGVVVGDLPAVDVDHDHILSLMSGRAIDSSPRAREPVEVGEVALSVEGLSVPGVVRDVSLAIRYREIVGLYGLVGSGRSEIALATFGALNRSAGTFTLDGRPYEPRSPRHAIDSGLAYLPEDRKTLGIFTGMSIVANLTASVLPRFTGALGALRASRLRDLTERWRQDLAIKTPTLGSSISDLSGGHQQKVLLARQLAIEPRVAILDEPTRGIDVATKTVIQERIRDIASDGMAVCVISSELPELLALCGRIIVIRSGRVVDELTGDRMTEENVLRASLGVSV